MPVLIALSEHIITVQSALNYICFMHIVVQFIVPNSAVNFNKCTYLKGKVAYNTMHIQILGYHQLDSASSMFVNTAMNTFDVLMHTNIYG